MNKCRVSDCNEIIHRRKHCAEHFVILKEHTQKSAEYRTWGAMKRRCNNPNAMNYKYYGALGVKVDDRWSDSFVGFILDVGLKPSPSHTLDRIDTTKGYSKDNCRWADKNTQARNRKLPSTNKSGYRGVSKQKKNWVASIGYEMNTFYLGQYKTPEEAALVYNEAARRFHGDDAVLNVLKQKSP